MAGLSGYIIGGAIALVVAVVGGTIVQLIKRLYIDEIKDTQSAAQNLTAFFIFVFTSVALGALFYQPFGVVLAAALALTFGVANARYWLILNCYGGSGASANKQAVFATFKELLAEGGIGVKRYEQYLGLALDRVDRFFGDDDPGVKTLWPGAFGFEGKEGKKPFWTTPAYDRCLTIALLYPLLAMMIIWTGTGAVGPGERAIDLGAGVEDWRRYAAMVCVLISGASFYLSPKADDALLRLVCLLSAGSFAFAGSLAGAGAAAFAVVVAFAFGGASAAFFAVVVAGAFASDFHFAASIAGGVVGVMVLSRAGFAGGLFFIMDAPNKRNLSGSLLLCLSLILLLLSYFLAYWFGGQAKLEIGETLLLFLGVFTLVNAPFDWLSIGLTRALLRRGVEAGGFAPVWLALLDLVLATLLIALLAAAMVFAVDLFEVVGRSKIIDVARVLDALSDPVQRLETKYWWIYATLFSTLIPSLLNVALAALSFMRGVIPFHRRVADRMLAGGETVGTAWWMAPALGLEVVGAAMIGLYLTYLWIFKAVPLLFQPFEWLIPMLRWVAGLV